MDMKVPGPALKMQRAVKHLHDTEQLISDYLQSSPYHIEVQTDQQSSAYVVTTTHTPPPDAIALSFGDFLNNLRSALDHLARMLVQQNGGIPVDGPGGTTFPITRNAKEDLTNIKGGATTPQREILHRVQPHQMGSDYEKHPLWKLNELNNIDKHRMLHVVNLVGYSNVAFFPRESQNIEIGPTKNRYPLSLHTTVPQRIDVAKEDLYTEAKAAGMHTTTVRLAPDEFCGGQHVWTLCHELYDFVRNEVLLPLVSA